MRKIFLFLFAAVLSIGTAMAANLDCAGATATIAGENLVLQGDADTGEKLTVNLWQGSTGAATGEYPVGDFDIILNNMTWLTAETAGVYTVMGNMFTFEATANDGSTQYSIYMTGSTASSEPETNEMEAKDEVSFTCNAEGAWTIEALADDYSWYLSLALEYDEFSGEYIASGTYVTDMVNWSGNEVAGTGQLYYDDFTGRQVFKATSLTDGSSEIYPVLYASTLNLVTEQLTAVESWWVEFIFDG